MPLLRRQVVLAARPSAEPRAEHFALVDADCPEPRKGEVLLRTVYLSIDPYLRGRMNAAKSYAPPAAIGEVLPGETIAEVVVSRDEGYRAGDLVEAPIGWQTAAVCDGRRLRRPAGPDLPPSLSLGVLGLPGLAAWIGMVDIGRPKSGDTIVVSSAAGAVGSLAGQLAKVRGARVVGIAGGPVKCRYLVETLGFDAAVDYQASDFPLAIREACPRGVDLYFDNVGGDIFDRVFPLLNDFARVPLCGQIAHYNGSVAVDDMDRLPLVLGTMLTRRITIQGFIVSDHLDRLPAFRSAVAPLVAAGRICTHEVYVEGLERAPEAFLQLLRGTHLGKVLVRFPPHSIAS